MSLTKVFLEKVAPKAARLAESIFSGELTKRAITSGERAISDLGPFGEMLVGATKKWADDVGREKGEFQSAMLGAVKGKLNDKSFVDNFADHWQNPSSVTDPAIADAVNLGKVARLNWMSELQKAGVKTGPLVADDWPRMYSPELFEGANRNSALSAMMRGGLNSRAADSLLDVIAGKSSKAYNYEVARKFDLPGYRRDLSVVFEDATHAVNRLNWAKTFGANDEGLDLMFKGIRETAGSSGEQLAREYIDAITKRGKYYRGVRPWEQKLGSLQVATKLGTAVISNMTQPLNNVVFAGRLSPLFKGMGDLIGELAETGNIASAKDFALRAGATWFDTRQEFNHLYGDQVGSLGSKVLKYTGFSAIEKLNRILSAQTGKHMAQEFFEDLKDGINTPLAKAKLSQLGVDADAALKRGFLNPDDYLMAAKRTSDVTQFISDANSLPIAWRNSPSARTVTQFKSFAYMQAKFLKDFAIKPAVEYAKTQGASGDLKPLAYMALLFPSIGEATADLRAMVQKGTLDERSEFPLERGIENMSQLGAFGMYEDLIYGMSAPSDSPLWHFIAGPTIGDVVDLSRLPASQQPIWNQLSRKIPIVGPRLAYEAREKSRGNRRRQEGFLESGAITKAMNQFTK
jgi:hypothetical protein